MIKVFSSLTGIEELQEVQSTLEAQWLGFGPKVEQFEKELMKRNGYNSVIMTDNCSNSLYTAIKVFNFKPGSQIILPALTFVSCAHAVLLNNCIPVFCDVEYDTMNCSIKTIEPLITKQTAAIMVMHYGGKPVDMKPIIELGIPIIEDAAHAVDSKYNGRYCGGLGDIGCLSFDSMKNLSAGEGGAIIASSPTFAEKIKRMRYCGIGKSGIENSQNNSTRWWETEATLASIRQMPNDVNASVALAQLRKLDKLQLTRKKIWETYQNEFEDLPLDLPTDAEENEQHSYFTYAIKIRSASRGRSKFIRDELAKELLYTHKIYTTLRYFPIHMMKIYKDYGNNDLTNTEMINDVALNLPIHPNITNNDLDLITMAIRSFFTK